MTEAYWLVMLCGVLAVAYGIYAIRAVNSVSAGNERMQEIATAIQEGANAYLNRQYTTIALVGVVIGVILGFMLNWYVAIGYFIGAILSGATGYIGMNVSVRANVRTADAARTGGRSPMHERTRSINLPSSSFRTCRSGFMWWTVRLN